MVGLEEDRGGGVFRLFVDGARVDTTPSSLLEYPYQWSNTAGGSTLVFLSLERAPRVSSSVLFDA